MTAPREVPAERTAVQGETVPSGMISVAMGKNCILLLSEAEYLRAIRAGKVWRRRTELVKRTGARS